MAATAHSRPPMAHASQKYGVSYSGTNSMTKPAMVATIMMQAHKPLVKLILAALAFDTGAGTLDLLIGRLGHAEQRADLLVGVHRAQGRRVGVHNDFTLVAFSNRLLARIVVVGDVQPAEHHGTVYDAPHADRNEPHHERGRLGLNKFAQGVGQSRKHDARKNERNARYKQPREKTLGALTIFHRVEILDEGVATLKLRMLKSSCYDKAETDGDAREQGG